MSASNTVVLHFALEETAQNLAKVLNVQVRQVQSAIELLDAGNTIPFIARYRKEATNGLDEIALRAIEDGLEKARELVNRKNTILKSLHEQGLLSKELLDQIASCDDPHKLEAIYAPYKPKRRTRATVARERGLEPLARILLDQKKLNKSKQEVLRSFVDPLKEVPDEQAALTGALDIVAELWADDFETRIWLGEQAIKYGRLTSKVKRGKKDEAAKFEMYIDHNESAARVPSHRFLAMKRGEADGILNVGIDLERDRTVSEMKNYFIENSQFEFQRELSETVGDCYDRLLQPATETATFQKLKERADEEAIQVFAKNLRELLLSPPAGPRVTLGVDPGFRTGCKLAVVDGTGKYLTHATIYPTAPTNDTAGATKTVLQLIQKYQIELIAIGNGTASRETDAFFSLLIRENDLAVTKAIVSESGASIYSASELAGKEYPNLDVTVRGAISIAHRLQDPLAELVKTDPKSIGVGQYQHDVSQTLLRKSLEREVESCVNSVGVDVNMASASLLSYVSGIGPKLAENIVAYRDAHGRFEDRKQLLKVPKLGAKAFEQAAGFMRIRDGVQPLDNSAVHPECYPLVEKIAGKLKISKEKLIGMADLASKIRPDEIANEQFGLITVREVLEELSKPNRDPRKEFQAIRFSDDVKEMSDLKVGRVLDGIVTNVTHFGAFVDIGVHQDGLIHVSQLADKFVANPNDIVSVGTPVRVKVLEVDVAKKRISLTRRLGN